MLKLTYYANIISFQMGSSFLAETKTNVILSQKRSEEIYGKHGKAKPLCALHPLQKTLFCFLVVLLFKYILLHQPPSRKLTLPSSSNSPFTSARPSAVTQASRQVVPSVTGATPFLSGAEPEIFEVYA